MPKTIQNRKIKIAVVGLGRISQYHFDAIQKHSENLELVAICDMSLDAVENYLKKMNVQGFTDLETMINSCEIDLLAICTPSGLHPAQTILAARHGCHVITEKPMATDWQDGVDMVRACQEEDVFLFVVKQNRWNKTSIFLKKAIEMGRFGKIYYASANVFWSRSQSYYNQGGWRGTRAMDGGAFMNQASHYIDLLHWLMGPVQSVGAMIGTLARQIESEDTGVMMLRWGNGAIGSVNVTTLTYPDDKEGSLTILGEKGSVRLSGKALNRLEWWEFLEVHEMDASIQEMSYETESVYGFGHSDFYANIVASLQGLSQPLVDGHEGLASLEILVAAYRAARDNVVVNLPLE